MKIGKLYIGLTNQGLGAPLFDECTTYSEVFDKATGIIIKTYTYRGYAVHLTPWRVNKYGERLSSKALVIAWKA